MRIPNALTLIDLGIVPATTLVSDLVEEVARERLEEGEVRPVHLGPPVAQAARGWEVEAFVMFAMRGRLEDAIRLSMVGQHRGVVGELHERTQRTQDGLRIREQVLVPDLAIAGSQPSTIASTLPDEPPPVDRRLADGFDAEVRVEVRQRHIPSVTDQVDEPGLGEHASQERDVHHVHRCLLGVAMLPVPFRVEPEDLTHRVGIGGRSDLDEPRSHGSQRRGPIVGTRSG